VSALKDFLLAPAPAPARPPRAAGGSHPSLAVVAPAPVLLATGCAAGVALARRARAARALVCTYTGADPVARAPRTPRDALGTSLGARGIAAQRRGRVLVAELPGDPAAAARTAAAGLAVAAPCVLAVALRSAALDEVLAGCDAVLVVASGDETLAQLTCASAAALGPAVARVDAPAGVVARAVTVAGLAAPAGLRRAIAGALP
jgi:hypothetical protein